MAKLNLVRNSAAGKTYDMTALGTTDWIGVLNFNGIINRKNATNQITNGLAGGAGPTGAFNGSPMSMTWTDGTAEVSGSSTGGIYTGTAVGQGLSLTVPAGTNPQTLRVYAGCYQSTLRVTATLSDGSAAAVTDSVLMHSGGAGSSQGEYVIEFSSAIDGQTLAVTMVNHTGGGNVNLQGATLSAITSGTITSQPPPNGQSQRFVLSTTNATSGSYSLSGANTANDIPFTVTDNSADFTITGLNPGTTAPTLTINGPGGSAAVSGVSPFSIAGVGGGGEIDEGEAPPVSTVTSVVVSPGTATGSTTFAATVNGTNSPSQEVTWSATAGTINSSGVFTAPAATGSVQTITVTARSVQDTTKTGTSTVTIAAIVQPPTVTAVVVTPSTAQVSGSSQQQFSAQVNGANSPSQSVTWAASAGSISSAGVFVAPAASNVVQTITITATSVQDPTKSGTATVTIAALVQTVTSVTISPSVGSIESLGTLQFTVIVAGANSPPQSVTWGVTSGSISSSGLFTAPVVQDDQEVTVTATSTFDPSKSGSALVTVNPILDVVYELESESPSVIVRTGSSDRLRLSLTFTDSPAPRGRTVTIGGSSTTITSG